MKNQYVGDLGDYGKYSLLKAFAENGIKVGINWYLTENDEIPKDGKFTDYLLKEDLKGYDNFVFEKLKRIAYNEDLSKNEKKCVQDVEKADIIPGAVFYHDLLKLQGSLEERTKERTRWFDKSAAELKGADLIFMDPDNGLLTAKKPPRRSYEKYALPTEVVRYFKEDHNVVYYCHKGRRTDVKWAEYKRCMFKDDKLGAHPIILTYHKGTQRSYVFLIHDKEYNRYRNLISVFLDKWDSTIFHEEGLSDNVQSFQERYSTRVEKENALRYMTDCQIDELIASTNNKTAKTFYASYKRGGISNS